MNTAATTHAIAVAESRRGARRREDGGDDRGPEREVDLDHHRVERESGAASSSF
jgi:hypothetical protein